MNGPHFRAFLWLRWRLLVNQLRRGGFANAVLLSILAGLGVLLAAGLFVLALLAGMYLLAEAPPLALLLTWDGVVLAFLFCWMIGVVTELQRSEALSLDKFLHLPVSLSGVFLINYLSSLFSLSLLLFLPPMLGLALGLVLERGPALLWLFPLLAAFLLMVTALTYQLQSWLAGLMANPRRRRAIIVWVTMIFILLCQLPNLVNVFQPWKKLLPQETSQVLEREQELQRELGAGRITLAEYQEKRLALYQGVKADRERAGQQAWHRVEEAGRWVNLVLPPGWLPLGALAAARGEALPPLLGTAGLALIGAASLWRSYRTTLRLYTGQFNSGKKPAGAAPAPAKAPAAVARNRPGSLLVEKELPWLPEQTAAIALGSFRSLTRAPEVKMLLMGPVILLVVFGSLLLSSSSDPPEALRPLMVFGGMAMVQLNLVQLIGNQFGFDRSGFRVYVLCPARRRDILLGKNLAVAPLALGLGAVVVLVLQAAYPMRWDHFLATFPQLVSMYLLFCLLANALSILSPIPISSGSLKPVNPKGFAILLQIAFVFLFPVALSPTLLPLAVESFLQGLGLVRGLPVGLVLSLMEVGAIGFLYHFVLTWQGAWFQSREQKILETVTSRAE